MTDLQRWSDPDDVRSRAAQLVIDTWAEARAANTTASYRSDWARWEQWRAETNTPTPETSEAFVLALSEFIDARADLSPRTLKRNYDGIRSEMRTRGLHVPDFPKGWDPIRKRIDNIARRQARPVKRAAPVSEGLLRQMVAAAPDSPRGTRDRAVALVGFLAALRRAEIAALDLADVEFHPEGMTLYLRVSKADQTAQGERLFVPLTRHPETCATRALQAWLAIRGDRPGPLFVSLHKGRVNPPREEFRLHGSTIYRTVRAMAAATGDPRRYSPHSLRAGLATATSKRGASGHAIKQQTRHHSLDMVEVYIRDGRGFEDNVVNLLDSL